MKRPYENAMYRQNILKAARNWINEYDDLNGNVKLFGEGLRILMRVKSRYHIQKVIPWDIIELDNGILWGEMYRMREWLYDQGAVE